MLTVTNGAIYETGDGTPTNISVNTSQVTGYGYNGISQTVDYIPSTQTVYWNSWPVYITTDKTKKAIEVLKALQAEKLLDCKSVPKFIELVEKIAGLL